jgi:hypothetical protein
MPPSKPPSKTRNGKDFHPPSSSSSATSEHSKRSYCDVASSDRPNPLSLLSSSPSATRSSMATQDSIPLSQVILQASKQHHLPDPLISKQNLPNQDESDVIRDPLIVHNETTTEPATIDRSPPISSQIQSLFELIRLQQTQIQNNDNAQSLRMKKITDSTDWIAKSVETQNKAIAEIMKKNHSPLPTSQFENSTNHNKSDSNPTDFEDYSIGESPNPICDHTSTSAPNPPTSLPQPKIKSNPDHNHFSKHTNDSSQNSLFNNNEFAIACNGKIKFIAIETALQKRCLENDSIQKIELFYSGLIRSVCYGFEYGLTIFPSFQELTSTIDFNLICTNGLVGSSYNKSTQIFRRIGDIIKDRLTSDECISTTKCPKARLVIDSNPTAPGWTLLEKLLCARVTTCGALPEEDLDLTRSQLIWEHQESFHSFYSRTQQLISSYQLRYQNPNAIPTIKILFRFITELNRAQTFVPYLVPFHTDLLKHIRQFGDHSNQDKFGFTIDELYQYLSTLCLDATPTSLDPSSIQRHKSSLTSFSPTPTSSSNDIASPTIAHSEYDPSLCAMKTQRRRCQVCLIGFHDEDDCYLRGPNFQDPALTRRIKIYNENRGHKPPKGHKIKEWRPHSIPPFPFDSKDKQSDRTKQHVRFNDQHKKSNKPFSNGSKKDADARPNINSIEPLDSHLTNENMEPPEFTDATPSMFSLISENELCHQCDDPFSPQIFSIQTPPPTKLTQSPPSYPFDISDIARNNISASQSTPDNIISMINSHHRQHGQPKKDFFLKHSLHLQSIPTRSFQPYCKSTFHVDSGANCWAVTDRSLFYFFVDSATAIKQVNGTSFTSPGWGGILIKLDDSVFGIYPVHYCPENPKNTFSPSALREYSGFHSTTIHMNEKVTMIDILGHHHTLPVTIHNDMDFVDLEIMTMSHSDHELNAFTSSTVKVRRSPRLQALHNAKTATTSSSPTDHASIVSDTPPPLPHQTNCKIRQKHHSPTIRTPNDKIISPSPSPTDTPTSSDRHDLHTKDQHLRTTQETSTAIFPKNVMSLIAAFYVQLHSINSPREQAIRKMNSLLSIPYRNLTSPSPMQYIHPSINATSSTHLFPVMNKLSRSSSHHLSPVQEYIFLHLCTMHSSKSTLLPMLSKQLLTDLPKSLHHQLNSFNCSCFICNLRKADKLPRGNLVDKTQLAPFQRLHIDFSFFTIKSIRGFTSSLDVECGSTSYPFSFPTKNKAPPLDPIRFTINTLRSQGFQVNFIRVDEDKALANSAEFCKLICDMNCILETTGGGNSTNNGMVERGNRVNANMVRTALTTMQTILGDDLPPDFNIEELWCFALQHSVFVRRRLYNRMRKEIPYFLVYKRRPSFRELIPFGSILTVIKPDKNLMSKLEKDRALKAHFLGFGNSDKTRIIWIPQKPRKYFRSHHCIVEDMATLSCLQYDFASPSLPSLSKLDEITSSKLHKSIVTPLRFDYTDDRFPNQQSKSFTFQLPPHPTIIGASFKNDPLINLPYLHHTIPHSFLYKHLPPGFRSNHFILSINAESPITVSYTIELLHSIQKSSDRTVTIELMHRGKSDNTTSLQITRAMFDNFPSIIMDKPMMNNLESTNSSPPLPQPTVSPPTITTSHVPITHSHFVTSPRKPSVPKSFFECLKSPLRRNWIAAAWNQFKKNKNIAVFSLPFDRSTISDDARIFRSQLIPEVKDTEVPGVFEFKVRDVIVGTPQQKEIDYKESYSPVVDPTSIRLQIAFSCSQNYILGIIDVKNAFQNTIVPPSSRIYVTVPPTYLQWLHESEGFKYDRQKTYIRQMLNSNQGTRDAGNVWYNFLHKVLLKYGLIRSTTDHGLFVRAYKDDSYLYVSLATDDMLCSFKTYRHFDDFRLFLQQYFQLSVQTGHVMNFLGLRVIQTNIGISLDQSLYVYDMLETFFGKNVEFVKSMSTPMRHDTEFEKEMHDAIPLSPSELKEYSLEYKGSYRFWTGKFNFAACITRFDIMYATQRLAEFNNSPTDMTFKCIKHLLRYLSKDVNRPLMFPRASFEEFNSVSYYVTPESSIDLEIANLPTLFTDAELARDLTTRRSYFCTVIVVLNVIIHMKVKKTDKIMQHTTDSEMNAAFAGVRYLKPIRQLFAFFGTPLGKPTTLNTDNAAVAAVINSGRITPRCRHIDIPIALLQSEKDKDFVISLVRTMLMLADMGTKPLSPVLLRWFKYWGLGARFLPSKDHPHYMYLQLEFYEISFAEIQRLSRT